MRLAFRAGEAVSDRFEDSSARLTLLDVPRVLALRVAPAGRAAVVTRRRTADDRQRAMAAVAQEQAREQVVRAHLRPVLDVPPADRVELLLRLVPDVGIDQCEVRTLARDHFAGIAVTREPAVGSRNLEPLPLLEAPDAGVTLVVEHRADRRRSPAPTLVPRACARRRETLVVECVGDRRERVAREIRVEDALDDVGLGVVDLDAATA